MKTRFIDTLKSWLWMPVIAVLILIANALEDHADKPRKEAGDPI